MLRFSNVQSSRLSHNNGSSSESRKSQQPKNNNMFMLGKLRGFGCKGMAMSPVSATVRSAVQEGDRPTRRKKKKKNQRKKKNIVDTSDICCAPPGISYISDVVPRTNMNAQRTAQGQHSRVARRRNANSHDSSASGSLRSSAEVLVSRQCHHLYIRFTGGTSDEEQHQCRNWRLNVDNMSYEELLVLGDKIGYPNRGGLCEKEIFHCLTKLSMAESVAWLTSGNKDWRCSICQEGFRSDGEIGKLGCGHCHHISCIKQWLRQKNECPICKIPPI